MSKKPVYTSKLFDNPMVNAARDAMTPEEKEQYRKIGEKMYGHLNFEDADHLIDPNIQMSEARICLEGQLRSGLHPSDMDDNEKAIMVDAYGATWYEKWGYVEQDLGEIVTTKPSVVVKKE